MSTQNLRFTMASKRWLAHICILYCESEILNSEIHIFMIFLVECIKNELVIPLIYSVRYKKRVLCTRKEKYEKTIVECIFFIYIIDM